MGSRPETPSAVKRRLRQEAAFGCCRCGFPFIEYHHIVPYAVEPHFRPEDMMAVCATCHQGMERGAVSVPEQRKFKSDPFNVLHQVANGTLFLKQDYIALDVGAGVYLVGDEVKLSFAGSPVLSLRRTEADTLSLSTLITDSEGTAILRIDDNDWSSLNDLPWDIEADWRKITIRQAARNIRFSLDATSIPMRLRGSWFWQGKTIRFDDSVCELGGPRFAHLGLVGMKFEIDHDKMTFGPSQGVDGVIISEALPRRRLYKCKNWLYAKRADRNQLKTIG